MYFKDNYSLEVRSRHPQANLQTTDSVGNFIFNNGFALGMAVEILLRFLAQEIATDSPTRFLAGSAQFRAFYTTNELRIFANFIIPPILG